MPRVNVGVEHPLGEAVLEWELKMGVGNVVFPQDLV